MTKLWAHQEEAVTLALQYDSFMFAHDMGCGKSFESIELANRLKSRLILILCPKSVISVWPKEFEKHSPKKFDILPLTTGTVKQKAARLEKQISFTRMHKRRLVVVVNYESAWRAGLGPIYKGKRIVKLGALLDIVWDLVICDESHRLKSPKSKTSWFAYKISQLKKAKYRLALTGTPMPHSPLDIYAQFRFLDWAIFGKNYTQFKARYAIEKDLGDFKKIVGFQRQDELKAKFYQRAHRVMACDVLDLPPVMHETRTCELSPKAHRIYHQLETEFVAWLDENDGMVSANNVLTKLLRLGQIAGGYLQMDNGESEFIDSSKLDLLKDVFEDLPQEEPIVIFSRFTNEIQRIKELAESMGRPAAELSGNMNQLAEWQNGEFNVIAIQIRSGGVGVDLTRARYSVYYSTGYSLGDYLQSLKRTDRPGQLREGLFIHLVVDGTVDVDVYNSLSTKQVIVDDVLAVNIAIRNFIQGVIKERFNRHVPEISQKAA